MDDKEAEDRLPWTTPIIVLVGSMWETRSDAGGDMDIDGLNEDPILMS